jgi:ABC-type iron transport system FetAB ATPase subunit
MSKGFRLQQLRWHTFEPLDLTLAPGQSMGLTGPSGSGKTLLLRALADLDMHDGRMWLDDRAADQIPAHQWRSLVGYLPAESAWWFDTVGEHLEQPSSELLVKLGFDTDVLQWEIRRLSSGERQRLGLLRLLVNRPRVLLLDEPTANLDKENSLRVEALLDQYRKKEEAVMVWVSHDAEQLQRWCDPVYTIEGRHLVLLPASARRAAGEGA